VPHVLESHHRKPKLSITLNQLVFLTCLLVVVYFSYGKYTTYKTEQKETSSLLLAPQVNDIYFLDFRLLSDKLARKNKYKLAKVVRVTDDNLVIVYGNFSYQWQYSVLNSIQYGDLNNWDYFASMPDYIPLNKIKAMHSNGAIYLIKRPIQNKLYGNRVIP